MKSMLNNTRAVLIVSAVAFVSGCASTKIQESGTEGALLNKVNEWNGKPLTIGVQRWDMEQVGVALRYNETIAEDGTYSYVVPDQLDLVILDPPKLGDTMEVGGREVVITTVPTRPNPLDQTKNLCESLNEAGLNTVDMRTYSSSVDYYIAGKCALLTPAAGSGGWIAWDVVMAVPAIFLPIPLGGINSSVMEIKLYDSDHTLINKRRLLDFDVKTVFYSLWSIGSVGKSRADAFADGAATLTVEMIREHENTKH